LIFRTHRFFLASRICSGCACCWWEAEVAAGLLLLGRMQTRSRSTTAISAISSHFYDLRSRYDSNTSRHVSSSIEISGNTQSFQGNSGKNAGVSRKVVRPLISGSSVPEATGLIISTERPTNIHADDRSNELTGEAERGLHGDARANSQGLDGSLDAHLELLVNDDSSLSSLTNNDDVDDVDENAGFQDVQHVRRAQPRRMPRRADLNLGDEDLTFICIWPAVTIVYREMWRGLGEVLGATVVDVNVKEVTQADGRQRVVSSRLTGQMSLSEL